MSDPIEVRKVPIESVSDASGLTQLIDDGIIDADRVIAVVGKTEGNGGVNDYTRIIADHAFRDVLVDKGTRTAEEVHQIPVLWSGGTDGVLSPHAAIFATVARNGEAPSDEPRLSVGSSMSEQILPEEIGRPEMVRKVADGVRVAMERAGITSPKDVHYVQTKTPLLDAAHHQRGEEPWQRGLHRGHAALDGRVEWNGCPRNRGGARRDRDADG